MNTNNTSTPLLSIQGLSVPLRGMGSDRPYAIKDISYDLNEREILCIVGESGSGKSMSANAIMGLLPDYLKPDSGQILFQGRDLLKAPESELLAMRGKDMAMVFQEPLSALNPVMTVGDQILEVMRAHDAYPGDAGPARVVEMLEFVGLPDPATLAKSYPFRLSGGQRQRVVIAMALALEPKLLIADEPTTALDVTLQHEVLMLIDELVQGSGMALLLISHDLGVMARHVQRLLVMYAGMVVESGPTAAVFAERAHPYTRGLYAARPRLGATRGTLLPTIPGRVPDLADLPAGCAFADRCEYAGDDCRRAPPPTLGVGSRHVARCLHPLAARAVGRGAPVEVRFAVAAGTLATLEGEVRYAAGDALVARSETDRWPIPRATFDSRYRPADAQPQGHDGRYLAQPVPVPVQARRLDASLEVALTGGRGTLRGAAGDWLVTHADGDLGIVAADVFAATYELIDDDR